MLYLSIIACLGSVLLSCPAWAADLAGEWSDLWTRCRTSIEQGQPLNTEGLAPFELPPGWRGDRSIDRARAWESASDRLLVEEYESERDERSFRRGCDVKLAPGAGPLSEAEKSGLIRAFNRLREALLAEGTYELRDPAPVFPVALGVGPVERTERDCAVISYLMIDQDGDFLASASAEQNDYVVWKGGKASEFRWRCGGPSFLSEADDLR